MRPDLKKEWIAALRSGDYLQGHGRLVRPTRSGPEAFCCIGVLCNIAAERGYGGWAGEVFVDEESMPNSGILKPSMLGWAGLLAKQQETLILLNDARGASFDEIADHIEENL